MSELAQISYELKTRHNLEWVLLRFLAQTRFCCMLWRLGSWKERKTYFSWLDVLTFLQISCSQRQPSRVTISNGQQDEEMSQEENIHTWLCWLFRLQCGFSVRASHFVNGQENNPVSHRNHASNVSSSHRSDKEPVHQPMLHPSLLLLAQLETFLLVKSFILISSISTVSLMG